MAYVKLCISGCDDGLSLSAGYGQAGKSPQHPDAGQSQHQEGPKKHPSHEHDPHTNSGPEAREVGQASQ